MSELKKLITLLTNKVNDMTILLERRTTTGHNQQQQQQGYGQPTGGTTNYAQQRQLHEQFMVQQQCQFEQRMAAQHGPQQNMATPSRTHQNKPTNPRQPRVSNGQGEAKTTGLSQTAKRIQNNEEENEPALKRTDDKRTPTRENQIMEVVSPPHRENQIDHRRPINPYKQPRQLQFRHEGLTAYYNPYNFLNKPGRENKMNPHGLPAYSQEYYPPFQYTPPSPDHPALQNQNQLTQEEQYQQETARIMQEMNPPSHPAKDAQNYDLP
jgi:hypothetical protein